MEKHQLTNVDVWFLQKGQIDSISRSKFAVGDEVVVCDRQHVMLADFYDGECPTCHSKKLVSFCRENVEPGTLHGYMGDCPFCNNQVTIVFSQHGIGKPYIGNCPSCKKKIIFTSDYFSNRKRTQEAERIIRVAGRMIRVILVALIMLVIYLNYAGVINNQELINHIRNVVIPETIRISEKITILLPENVLDKFLTSFQGIMNNTDDLLVKGRDVGIIMFLGFQTIAFEVLSEATKVFNNTKNLFRLFREKTMDLLAYFK